MELPEIFKQRMEQMLGEAYPAFLAAYEHPHKRGIRLNTLKCDEETLQKQVPFAMVPSPFSPLSYYAPQESKMLAMPLYHAGAFYAQEPSAASAVTLLDPQPGERVLDLCAAPGGKSTQIAALMQDQGLLWSNEVVKKRATVLASNLERMGVRNAVVSSVYPDALAEKLPEYFDRVLVDAPCSGEGMFRRDPEAVAAWSPEHVQACAQRQKMILDSAAACVRQGGVLVYSTCTFSMEENEGVVSSFLQDHPEFSPETPVVSFGRPAYGDVLGVRVFPMDGGEGHFAARFRKNGTGAARVSQYVPKPNKAVEAAAKALYSEVFIDDCGVFSVIQDRILMLPQILPDLSGLHIVRAGVDFGTIRKNRIEPEHGIFMAHRPETCRSVLDLSAEDPRVALFLRGNEIEAPGCVGYTAVAVCGVVCGFGKVSGGMLKNKYPKGLRIQK